MGMWRKQRPALAVLGMAIGLSGCWPGLGAGADRAGYNGIENTVTTATVDRLGLAWQLDLTDDPEGSPAVATLVASSETAVVTNGGRVTAVDLDNGQPRWTNRQDVTWENPWVDRGDVSVVQFGVNTVTNHFDELTGGPRPPTAHRIESYRGSRTLLQDTVLDPGTLETTNSFTVVDENDPSSDWGGVYASGFVVPGYALTFGETRVYAAGYGPMPNDTPPRHGLRAFARGPAPCSPTACLAWGTDLDGLAATLPILAPDESLLFTATDAGTVYAVDPATGAVRWSAPVGSPVRARPAFANGILYVAPAAGQILAFPGAGCGAATCAPLFTLTTGGQVLDQPAVAGGLVFAGTASGSLQAFTAAGCGAASCAPVWSHELGVAVTAGPIVTVGHVLVGTAQPGLVNFHLT